MVCYEYCISEINIVESVECSVKIFDSGLFLGPVSALFTWKLSSITEIMLLCGVYSLGVSGAEFCDSELWSDIFHSWMHHNFRLYVVNGSERCDAGLCDSMQRPDISGYG